MKVVFAFCAFAAEAARVSAYTPNVQNAARTISTPTSTSTSTTLPDSVCSRRAAFTRAIAATGSTFAVNAAIASSPLPANAFDGSGSSAYSGKNPQSVLERRKSYQARVAADAKDFVRLGKAIKSGNVDPESDPWLFFFFPYERREPDSYGRTYAACSDLIGHLEGRELVGGDGYLLASTFTKKGKPPENTPAVKSFAALSKAFDPIKAAGGKKDAGKAKTSWEKAAVLFSKYLEDVELPADLNDPIYQ